MCESGITCMVGWWEIGSLEYTVDRDATKQRGDYLERRKGQGA